MKPQLEPFACVLGEPRNRCATARGRKDFIQGAPFLAGYCRAAWCCVGGGHDSLYSNTEKDEYEELLAHHDATKAVSNT